jgi:hypothetical protein
LSQFILFLRKGSFVWPSQPFKVFKMTQSIIEPIAGTMLDLTSKLSKLLTEIPESDWLLSETGSTVYALQHYGWRKGEEQFCNTWQAQISGTHNGASEDEVKAITELMSLARETAALLVKLAPVLQAAEELAGRTLVSIEIGDTDTDPEVVQALDAYLLAASTAMEPVTSEVQNGSPLQGLK